MCHLSRCDYRQQQRDWSRQRTRARHSSETSSSRQPLPDNQGNWQVRTGRTRLWASGRVESRTSASADAPSKAAGVGILAIKEMIAPGCRSRPCCARFSTNREHRCRGGKRRGPVRFYRYIQGSPSQNASNARDRVLPTHQANSLTTNQLE